MERGAVQCGNDPITGVDPERSVYALVTQRPVWSSVAV